MVPRLPPPRPPAVRPPRLTKRNYSTEPKDVERSEILASWALFIQVSLVLLALFFSYYLQLKKIQAVHETVVSIFAGTCCVATIRAGEKRKDGN